MKMDINQIATMSRKELMDCVSEKKKEIAKKLENGETETIIFHRGVKLYGE